MIALRCAEGGLEVVAEVLPVYSYTLWHAGLCPVWKATAHNASDAAANAAAAVFEIEAAGARWRAEIPALGPGAHTTVDARMIEVDRDGLERLTRPTTCSAVLRFGGSEAQAAILLCAAWDWPVVDAAVPTLAAYVLRHDGMVRALASEAITDEQGSGDPSAQIGGATGCITTMLYEHLARTWRIAYSEPLITQHPVGIACQRVRPPYQVLYDRGSRRGEGTCIELVLTLAGCLEGRGLAPVVVLMGDERGVPYHALLGAWMNGRSRLRPIVRDADRVREWVRRGDLLLIETTGVCVGERSMSYRDAEASAAAQLGQAQSVCALDIAACRPPAGRLLPLEMPLAPAVLQAYAEVSALARRNGSMRFETLHLLYGVVSAGGEVGSRILAESGVDAERLKAQALSMLAGRKRGGGFERTVGYDRCVNDAIENARAQGSTIVRECDLWWAILRSRSGSLDRALGESGSSTDRLVEILTVLCPQYRPTTTMA